MLEDFFLGNEVVWNVSEPEPSKVKEIADKLKLPSILAKVLVKRGLTDTEHVKNFLRPSVSNLNNPMLLPDMDIAVNRILTARELGEKVVIYGDYDVDGITATSILYLFLQSIGIEVSFYIPDRVDEGYGISEVAVDYLCKNYFDLMITVDCGISAKNRIEQIQHNLSVKNRKMDIIVTDHHQPDIDNLPEVLAIINPHLPYSEYPFDKLCGAGVAFKLVQALCDSLSLGDEYFKYVDLACLGTVADIVELTGENRAIVQIGLRKIQKRPNAGIQALLNVVGLKNDDIDAHKLAFILAPRINAAGRMGDASRAVNLFTSKDLSENEELARQLHNDNILRQKIQTEIFQKAVEAIESDLNYKNQKVIVVSGDGWNQGVIGIVASMLVEHYYKPCFVISFFNDEGVCSARSIEGFNIFDSMEYCRELLVKYGGHEKAGGLTINKSNLVKFKDKINEFADKVLQSSDMKPKIEVDADVEIEEISIDSANLLMAMAPFGEGNPSPLFRLKEITILEKKLIGSDRSHLKLVVGSNNNSVHAVAFRMGYMEQLLQKNSKVDLIFEININEYMGRKNTQLIVKSIRMPEKTINRNKILLEAAEKVEYLDNNTDWIYNRINNQLVNYKDVVLSRQELGVVYRYLQHSGSCTFTRGQLFELAQRIDNTMVRMNYFKVISGMLILKELDIIKFSKQDNNYYKIALTTATGKATLKNSKIYSFLHNLDKVAEK